VAVGVLFEFEGMTRENYDAFVEALTGRGSFTSPDDLPAPGLLSHAAGATATGWRVFDVWESEQAFAHFAEKLAPIAQQAGMEIQPEIFQLYNFVR
jgi:hypothetical protein